VTIYLKDGSRWGRGGGGKRRKAWRLIFEEPSFVRAMAIRGKDLGYYLVLDLLRRP
jgi:hypothetical protein